MNQTAGGKAFLTTAWIYYIAHLALQLISMTSYYFKIIAKPRVLHAVKSKNSAEVFIRQRSVVEWCCHPLGIWNHWLLRWKLQLNGKVAICLYKQQCVFVCEWLLGALCSAAWGARLFFSSLSLSFIYFASSPNSAPMLPNFPMSLCDSGGDIDGGSLSVVLTE